jgi:GT2 family glycosyltransferase
MSHGTTVLVLSVDEAPLLEHSLPAAVAQPGADVLVVDNACTDTTRSVAQACGARVLELRERLSYAAAINAGIVATEGDAVLLLNADCVLDAGFLDAARPRLEMGGVGSVAPRLVRATGMRSEDRLDVLDAAGMVVDRRRKNALVGHNEPASAYSHAAEVFGGDGACVLYRREVLDACAVGGEVFDEDLELWASDVDLAWRARLLGWRCIYEPRAIAWHMRFYSPSTRASLPEAHRRLQFRNRLLMMAKNDSWADVRGDLHRIAFYELLAIGHVLLRERHLLRAYGEAVRALPAARRRRRVVQAKRAAGVRPPFGLRAPR